MFCVSMEGAMWIYMNDHKRRSGNKTTLRYKVRSPLSFLILTVTRSWPQAQLWPYYNSPADISFPSFSNQFLYFVNAFVVISGFFLLGVGLWSSIVGIRDQFASGEIGTSFCFSVTLLIIKP
jgi:hypothetical protein